MKKIIIAVLAILIILGLWFMMRSHKKEEEVTVFDSDGNAPAVTIFDSNAAAEDVIKNDRSVPITTFVTRNISDLSTEAGFPEVLGGTFHVTKIAAKNGTGTVSYEDGHNSYSATFTYVTEKGLVSVKTFTIKN